MPLLPRHPKRTIGMAARAQARPLHFPVALILLAFAFGGTVELVQGQRTWCVAKPSANDATLQANIGYACGQVDCSILSMGGECYYPDKLISHASVAMNLYYQASGRNPWNCEFVNSALVVMTDPSFGNCSYA